MKSIRFQVLALVAYQTAVALDVQTSIETSDLFDAIELSSAALPSDDVTPAKVPAEPTIVEVPAEPTVVEVPAEPTVVEVPAEPTVVEVSPELEGFEGSSGYSFNQGCDYGDEEYEDYQNCGGNRGWKGNNKGGDRGRTDTYSKRGKDNDKWYDKKKDDKCGDKKKDDKCDDKKKKDKCDDKKKDDKCDDKDYEAVLIKNPDLEFNCDQTKETVKGYFLPGVFRYNVVNNHASLSCRFQVGYLDLVPPVIWSSADDTPPIEVAAGKAYGFDLQVDNYGASIYKSALKKKGKIYERIPSIPAEVWHAGTHKFSIQKAQMLKQKYSFTQTVAGNTKCKIIDMTYVDQDATLNKVK